MGGSALAYSSLFVDETSGSGSGGLVELIDLGEVSPTFSSSSSAAELDDPRSPIFPASNTQLSIRLQLNSTAPAVVIASNKQPFNRQIIICLTYRCITCSIYGA